MQTDAPPSVPPTHPDYPPHLLARAISVYILDSSAGNQQDQDNALATIRQIVEVHGPRCLNWAQVNIFYEGDTLFTPLQFACANPPEVAVINLLIELRARPEACNSMGEDALTYATRSDNGSHEAVDALLEAGVHPFKHAPVIVRPGACTRHELTPGRITYSLEPDQEIPQPATRGIAISYSFSVDPPMEDTETLAARDLTCRALMYGCCKVNSDKSTFTRRKSTIQLLNQDMYITDSTLLFRMLRNGYCNSALWILDNYEDTADPNLGRDMFGNTPLHYAIRFHGVLVTRELIRHGADMLALSIPPRPLPDRIPDFPNLTQNIGRAPITPVELLALYRGANTYSEQGREALRALVTGLVNNFRYPIIPMWLWQEKYQQPPPTLSWMQICRRFAPPMPSDITARWPLEVCWNHDDSDAVKNSKALRLWADQCRYRGRSFHGWHRLPKDVIRIIIRYLMPASFHAKALDARLQRYTEAYHRGVDAKRRRLADFYTTVSSTRLLCYTEAWHRDH